MKHNEIEISLTQFVDFIVKSGPPRLTEVQRIKLQHKNGYHPKRDFYRKLRDGIIDYHENNLDTNYLDTLANGITDKKKQKNYPELIKAYKSFIGRKKVGWFQPEKNHWDYKGLRIIVNPELGLILNDKKLLLKLYFKKDPALSKQRIQVLSNLMKEIHEIDDVECAILDVRQSKVHYLGNTKDNMLPLLHGDADAFITMYKTIRV